MAETLIDLEQVPWPALLVDPAGVIRRANAAARRIFGARLEGRDPSFSALWAPDNPSTAAQFLGQIRKTTAAVLPAKLRGPMAVSVPFTVTAGEIAQGAERWTLLQLFPGNSAGASEGRAQSVEVNLAQKQKLDCALQLARTVALDFNNTLTTILGHVSHLLSQAAADHPWRAALNEVEKAAGRAAEIANQLAAFSTEDKDARSRAAGNLNQLIRRTVELFRTPQYAGVSWVLQLEPKLLAVKYDEAKVQQAIMKVLENAVQALPSGGRVVVQTRNLELAEPVRDNTALLQPGCYVCIEIADDGCGIAPETLPRVFEPFFTTKPGHRGLGLAWVYGIVTNHGGGVAISNQVGQGTSVRVYLPALKRVVAEKALPEHGLGGGQNILVVDDEEMVLTMAEMVLGAHGYHVHTAPSGEKALELLTRRHFDLLITDMVMPGMNGRELIEKARLLSPATRIVCSSGAAAQMSGPELDILSKPFTSQQLLRKVQEALAS